MNKNKYEKHIAGLETKIEDLEASNAELRGRAEIEVTRRLRSTEATYRNLTKFLSELYAQLGNIQGVVLQHLTKLNQAQTKMHSARAEALMRELQGLPAPKGIKLSAETWEKTAAGLMDNEEGE